MSILEGVGLDLTALRAPVVMCWHLLCGDAGGGSALGAKPYPVVNLQ